MKKDIKEAINKLEIRVDALVRLYESLHSELESVWQCIEVEDIDVTLEPHQQVQNVTQGDSLCNPKEVE